MNVRHVLLALLPVALLATSLSVVTSASAATRSWGPLHPTDDPVARASGTFAVGGDSYALTTEVAITKDDGDIHCLIVEYRIAWPADPADPVRICGTHAWQRTEAATGAPIPSTMELRVCSTVPFSGATIENTCTGWQTLRSVRDRWGGVKAKKGKIKAKGWTKQKRGKVSAKVKVVDRTKNQRRCGWAKLVFKKEGGGKAKRKVRACNGKTKDKVNVRKVTAVFVKVCKGKKHRIKRKTCSKRQRIR